MHRDQEHARRGIGRHSAGLLPGLALALLAGCATAPAPI